MFLFTERQYRLLRIWSNRMIKQLGPIFHGDIVNVSGWDDRDKEGRHYKDYFVNAKTYSITNFTGERGMSGVNNEFFLDLSKDLPSDLTDRFDVCFNHTTLEHIFEVRKAFSSICRMSRDIVFIVVPFCQVQHENDSFKDFWRFTPTCMRYLFQENGMEVVYEVQSPYRNAGVYLIFIGSKYPEKWKGVLPSFEPIKAAGSWIGRNFLAGIRRHLTGH